MSSARRLHDPYNAKYVDAPAGWRAFFISILVASILGVAFKTYFAPPRLKQWVTQAIGEQRKSRALAIGFDRAELSLSRAGFPELALVLSNVKVAPNTDCHPEASISIASLHLPVRLRSLVLGRLAIGVVHAEDLRLDLDGLRAHCAASTTPESGTVPSTVPTRKPIKSAAVKKVADEPPRDWWTDEQFETARANVEGIEFSRATLQFENREKEIYLDSFSARFRSGGEVQLRTDMRIPPAVVYGEQIPPLRFEGGATKTKANLLVSLSVSEGSLTTHAIFTPGANQTLMIDANVAVKSLPLSMVTPLLRKAGVVDQKFNPRFLWVDCSGSIAGEFQGLFQTRPFLIKDCKVEGDGTEISIGQAERLPSGQWAPFDVRIASLDLAKLLSTMGVVGPDGIVSKFGLLSGNAHIESNDAATFSGTVRDVDFIFSNKKTRAAQSIQVAAVQVTVTEDRFDSSFSKFELKNGELSGNFSVHLDRAMKTGRAQIAIENLELDQAVQDVLIAGRLGPLSANASFDIADARMKGFTSSVKIGASQGRELKFETLNVAVNRSGEGEPKIDISAPHFQLLQSSSFFGSLKEALLGHEIAGDWIDFENVRIESRLLEESVFEWTKAQATIENGRVRLISEGTMSRERTIAGHLKIDFPKIKDLEWTLSGSMNSPTLTDDSESLRKLRARVEINDDILGL